MAQKSAPLRRTLSEYETQPRRDTRLAILNRLLNVISLPLKSRHSRHSVTYKGKIVTAWQLVTALGTKAVTRIALAKTQIVTALRLLPLPGRGRKRSQSRSF